MGRDNMINFGSYLKDYLDYNNISQSEFALRLGISQKHMNEIINGKKNITLEMAGNIERLTNIPSDFIMRVEIKRILTNELIRQYNNEMNILKLIKEEYSFKELKEKNWIEFKDVTNPLQSCIDILNFLNVKNFEAHNNLKKYTLFKKNGDDYNKLALWIAHCDQISKNQKIGVYSNDKFNEIIRDLLIESNKKGINLDNIKKILNKYGIFFVCEKALSGTKVRGCFKVKGKVPAIYITGNYKAKDSLFFELFHELGHLKSDYTIAQSKTIIDGDQQREERADKFAYNTMINENVWNEIISTIDKNRISEKQLKDISKKYNIPMCFMIGRLAKNKYITYSSKLYNDYRMI